MLNFHLVCLIMSFKMELQKQLFHFAKIWERIPYQSLDVRTSQLIRLWEL
jgi:hypothetical protein